METNKHRKWPDTFIFSLGSATAIFPNDIEIHFNMGFDVLDVPHPITERVGQKDKWVRR